MMGLSACALLLWNTHNAKAIQPQKRLKKLLVVTVTKGFRHDSIPVAEEVIRRLGEETQKWETDFVRNDEDMAQKMTPEALKNYDGIVFANTTGVLPIPKPEAFLDFIRSGKGFVGMHSATDTFHEWNGSKAEPSEYIKMIGAEFKTHGRQCAIDAFIADPAHPALKPVAEAGKEYTPAASGTVNLQMNTSPEGGVWKAFDEIYILKNIDRANLRLLLWLDKHPDDGSKEANQAGENLVSWCRAYGKGRVFYTSLGHRREMWLDSHYRKHITGGILFALGLAKGSTRPTPLSK
jgi:type 1 glutamine amidotransferase